MLTLFAGPVGMMALGIVIVLAVGYWAMNRDPKPANQTPSPVAADSGRNGTGVEPAEKGSDSTGSDPSSTGTPGSAPSAPAVSPSDQTIAARRAAIDRSAGAAKTFLVTVYYADGLKNGESLQPVEIQIPLSVSRIRDTVQHVIEAPQELKLYSNIPTGTQVLGVDFDESTGIATVDLSPEVTSVQGSAAVNTIMASLVYSLTEIPQVTSVQLWANGHPAVLHGMEWSKPLTRAEIDARNLFHVESVITYGAVQ